MENSDIWDLIDHAYEMVIAFDYDGKINYATGNQRDYCTMRMNLIHIILVRFFLESLPLKMANSFVCQRIKERYRQWHTGKTEPFLK